MSQYNSPIRGGQMALHSIKMTAQVIRRTFKICLVVSIAATIIFVLYQTSWRQFYAAFLHMLAGIHLGFGVPATDSFSYFINDGWVTTSLGEFYHNPHITATRQLARERLFASLWELALFQVLFQALAWMYFYIKGRKVVGRQRLRGAWMTTAEKLDAIITRRNAKRRLQDWALFRGTLSPPYRLAGIRWPLGEENLHTLITGTTGAGKTVAISDLVEQIRHRGGKAVIYDRMGHYLSKFYDPSRDIILAPMDKRGAYWSPFHEGNSVVDFETMGKALLPRTRDLADPFWLDAARVVFSRGTAALAKKGPRTNEALHQLLLKANMHELYHFMKGTEVQSILDEKSEKVALSVRSVMTTHLGCLGLLPDQGKPFSIRQWMADEHRSGFLFLMSRADIHESLRGLLSCWLETSLTALLSLPQNTRRRVWYVLDELASLHQIPSLVPGLAESRQFGGCFVLGVQVMSALRDIYGHNNAQTISGMCGTRMILSAPDQDTAQWGSDSLGRIEEQGYRENYSYGAHDIRDGISYNQDRQLRPLVYPSDIMGLPNLQGYLKMPRDLPVSQITMTYRDRPSVAARFVPREQTQSPPPKKTPGRKKARQNTAQKPAPKAPEPPPPPQEPRPVREPGAGAVDGQVIPFPKSTGKAGRSKKQRPVRQESLLPLPPPQTPPPPKKTAVDKETFSTDV